MSESDELINKADALLERWRRGSVSPRPPADYPLLTEVLQESGHGPSELPPTTEAPAEFKIPSLVDSGLANEGTTPQEYAEERPADEQAPDSAVALKTADTTPAQAEASLAEPKATPAEFEATPAESDAIPTEPEATPTEPETTPTEPEATAAESEATLAEPGTGAGTPIATVEDAPAARAPTAEEVEERVYMHLLETIESCVNASIEEPLRTRTQELARDLAVSIAGDIRNDILTLVRDAVRDAIAREIQSRQMP